MAAENYLLYLEPEPFKRVSVKDTLQKLGDFKISDDYTKGELFLVYHAEDDNSQAFTVSACIETFNDDSHAVKQVILSMPLRQPIAGAYALQEAACNIAHLGLSIRYNGHLFLCPMKDNKQAKCQFCSSLISEIRVVSALSYFTASATVRTAWLNTPNPDLDNSTPSSVLQGEDSHIVADLLEDALMGQPG